MEQKDIINNLIERCDKMKVFNDNLEKLELPELIIQRIDLFNVLGCSNITTVLELKEFIENEKNKEIINSFFNKEELALIKRRLDIYEPVTGIVPKHDFLLSNLESILLIPSDIKIILKNKFNIELLGELLAFTRNELSSYLTNEMVDKIELSLSTLGEMLGIKLALKEETVEKSFEKLLENFIEKETKNTKELKIQIANIENLLLTLNTCKPEEIDEVIKKINESAKALAPTGTKKTRK